MRLSQPAQTRVEDAPRRVAPGHLNQQAWLRAVNTAGLPSAARDLAVTVACGLVRWKTMVFSPGEERLLAEFPGSRARMYAGLAALVKAGFLEHIQHGHPGMRAVYALTVPVDNVSSSRPRKGPALRTPGKSSSSLREGKTSKSMAMDHRRDLDEAVDKVRQVRSDFEAPGIVAALIRAMRKGASLERALAALIASARDPLTRTPMRVVCDGWWWDEGDPRRAAPLPHRGARRPSSLLPRTEPDVPAARVDPVDAGRSARRQLQRTELDRSLAGLSRGQRRAVERKRREQGGIPATVG